MIKNYLTYMNENSKYGNRFIPLDIYYDLQIDTLDNITGKYEMTIQNLMNGKYARFSIIKNNPDDNGYAGGLAEGYVNSVKLIKGMGSFLVKMKGIVPKTYTLNVLEEVRVYDTKPKLTSSIVDPLGEEDWDD